jgi:hypothetical protein
LRNWFQQQPHWNTSISSSIYVVSTLKFLRFNCKSIKWLLRFSNSYLEAY